jgi:hypothetical protein
MEIKSNLLAEVIKNERSDSSITKEKKAPNTFRSFERQKASIRIGKGMKRWIVNISRRKGYKSVRISAYTSGL